ncbi:MAG: DUF4340 domain-containing protein [Bacteroidales bacterium]|nr:DUF4340 domain-containing protein [Bacteroidales bacterium]MCF8338380.1 DUF4340 domain-containing protein [Bacteroidales bacterium]
MKRKNLIILIVTGVLLLTAVGLILSQESTTLNKEENAFAVEDTASVTKIFLADKDGHQVLLNKKQPDKWMLNDSLPAQQESVDLLLETIHKLAIDHPVSNAAHNSVVSRLASRSVKVEVYQQLYRINLFDKIKLFPYEENTKTFFVGGETKDKMGTYMLMEGADKPYVVAIPGFRGFVSTRFTARFRDWRSHIIFNSDIKEIESLAMKFHNEPEKSFRIEVEDSRSFSLYDISEQKYVPDFDTIKVIEYLTAYRDLRFESWLNYIPDRKKDSITSQEPMYGIHLKGKDGGEQHVKTYKKETPKKRKNIQGKPLGYDPDRMYATINDGNDFVLVQFFVFDKILKPIGYFTGDYELEKPSRGFREVQTQ